MVTLRMPKKIAYDLKVLAAKSEKTNSELIVEALEDLFKKYDDKEEEEK